ncbi:MAG: TSUP family transporter [Caldithrix sp.]|nr:TSUP family transporter [Caldithrix sp.]
MEYWPLLLFSILIVSFAYFVKGFSGFGPALILIPLFSILYDPQTAISVSALFDIFAGLILFFFIRNRIDWKNVWPVVLALFAGAYGGGFFLSVAPTATLKVIMAFLLLIFIALLLLEPEQWMTGKQVRNIAVYDYKLILISMLSGFIGGLIGISGPLLVIYMKWRHHKTYFRNQLITIFFLGAVWRFAVYRVHNIQLNLSFSTIAVLLLTMAIALFIGQHFHKQVDEKKFNRMIAILLIIPVINLILF